MEFEFFFKVVLALAVGGLIGLERQRSGHVLVGVRTFALLSFFGMLLAAFGEGQTLAAIGLVGALALGVFYYYNINRKLHGQHGMTTALMMPLTYLLGVFVGFGRFMEAGVAAILATYLLVEKREVHQLARTITKDEMVDILLFAVIAFVIYPTLPAEPVRFMGQEFSLTYFWTIVVLMSAISFFAHFLTKYLRKGFEYAAFLGGFMSSHATVVLLSGMTKDYRVMRLANGLASSGTAAGDLLVIGIGNTATLAVIAPVFLPAILGFMALSWLYLRSFTPKLRPEGNALSLKIIFEFAAIFAAVSLVINSVAANTNAVLLVSFLSGLVSSTSAAASTAYLFAQGRIDALAFAASMALSVSASALARSTITIAHDRKHWRALAEPFVASVVFGLAGVVMVWFLRPSL